tara:strand:- start:2384 stop:4528 length:2145 start_codon:yes stop_codon:yes gene_type:complete
MSLVILHNNPIDPDGMSEWEKPYSFHNALKETMIIEPDSEVALQSVKINKNNLIGVNFQDFIYFYLGPDLMALDYNVNRYITTPIPQSLSSTPRKEYLDLAELNDRMTTAMNDGNPHPDVYGKNTSELVYNTTSKLWEGFKFSFEAMGDNGDVNTQIPLVDAIHKYPGLFEGVNPMTATHVGADNHLKLAVDTKPAGETEAHVATGRDMIMKANPISHYNGEVRFDIGGVCVDELTHVVDTPCAMGLVRPIFNWREQYGVGTGGVGGTEYEPVEFEQETSDLDTFNDAGEEQIYDYVIRLEKVRNAGAVDPYLLWLGQYALNGEFDDTGGEDYTTMREIKYYTWDTTGTATGTASAFANKYNMTTNTENINQFKITIEGEKVSFWYHTGTLDHLATGVGDANNGGAVGTWTILCSVDQNTEAGWKSIYTDDHADPTNVSTYQSHVPKPVGQNSWVMYPSLWVGGDTDAKSLTISKWGGRSDVENQITDFYGQKSCYYLRTLPDSVLQKDRINIERRYPFSMGGYDTGNYGLFYTAQEVNAGVTKLATGYAYQILFDSNPLYEYPGNTLYPSHSDWFGMSVGVVTPTTSDTYDASLAPIISYKSDKKPSIISESSLFVRLNDLSQISYNAGTGRPSKIIYALPRFDNSGNENGDGLFFEPGQKTYIRLGNSEKMYVNDFNMSIVNKDEHLAKNLTGTTLIVLHIREHNRRLVMKE